MTVQSRTWTLIWSHTLLLGLTLSQTAWSRDPCVAYRNQVPIPKWYDSICTKGGHSKNPSGTYSSISDAFRVNPSTLPTHTFPYGIEWIASYLPGNQSSENPLLHNFALIKGFERIGAGASSSSEFTFFSNSPRLGLEGTESPQYESLKTSPRDSLPLLNLGTSFGLGDTKGGNPIKHSIGVSVRINTETDEGGSGLGYTLSNSFLSIGLGLGSLIPDEDFTEAAYGSLTLGVKTPWINAEYILIQNEYDEGSTYPTVKVQILALSRNFLGFLITGAVRRIRNFEGLDIDQPHFSIQYAIGGRFSIGYLYNYLPDAHSLGAQVLLF